MIVKIPIYIEVETKEDYNPIMLKSAIDSRLPEYIFNILQRHGSFPFSTEDIIDNLGRDVAKRANVKRLSISLIKQSEVFRKVNDH